MVRASPRRRARRRSTKPRTGPAAAEAPRETAVRGSSSWSISRTPLQAAVFHRADQPVDGRPGNQKPGPRTGARPPGLSPWSRPDRVVFALAILIIAVVAVIIIMNTLVVSISERTAEIGTMRALGAQKGFVWRMLFLETLAISVLFGAVGMALGSAVVGILNAAGIPASGPSAAMIAGSSTLRPTVAASSLGGSVLLVIPSQSSLTSIP